MKTKAVLASTGLAILTIACVGLSTVVPRSEAVNVNAAATRLTENKSFTKPLAGDSNLKTALEESHEQHLLQANRSRTQALTAQIRDLSLIVMPNESEKQKLTILLSDKDLQNAVRSTLLSADSLTEAHFSERSALLDVLYEGLKAREGALNSAYLDLAEEILAAPAGPEITSHKPSLVQYFGDRVEIAMVVAKISGASLERLRSRAVAQNPESARVFDRASKLASVYEVSL